MPDASHEAGRCAANPRGCADRELLSPVDCACLAACEAGWRWTDDERRCAPEGGDAGTPYDAGFFLPDSGLTSASGSPFTATIAADLSERLALAWAGFAGRCEPAIGAARGVSAADVLTRARAVWAADFAVAEGAVAAGRSIFLGAVYDRCVAALANDDCDLGEPPDCDRVFAGLGGLFDACAADLECGPGLFCDAAEGGCPARFFDHVIAVRAIVEEQHRHNLQVRIPARGDFGFICTLEGLDVCDLLLVGDEVPFTLHEANGTEGPHASGVRRTGKRATPQDVPPRIPCSRTVLPGRNAMRVARA